MTWDCEDTEAVLIAARELGFDVFEDTQKLVVAMMRAGLFLQAADVLNKSNAIIEALTSGTQINFLFPKPPSTTC